MALFVASVHRRVGGLEATEPQASASQGVHRRVGGLEALRTISSTIFKVHRRVGGLEDQGPVEPSN